MVPETPKKEKKSSKDSFYLPTGNGLVSTQSLEVFGWSSKLTKETPERLAAAPVPAHLTKSALSLKLFLSAFLSQYLRSFWDSLLPTFFYLLSWTFVILFDCPASQAPSYIWRLSTPPIHTQVLVWPDRSCSVIQASHSFPVVPWANLGSPASLSVYYQSHFGLPTVKESCQLLLVLLWHKSFSYSFPKLSRLPIIYYTSLELAAYSPLDS